VLAEWFSSAAGAHGLFRFTLLVLVQIAIQRTCGRWFFERFLCTSKAGGDNDDENCTQKSLLIGCHIVFYVQIFIFLAHSYGDDMSAVVMYS
jgi:hypothetical protein